MEIKTIVKDAMDKFVTENTKFWEVDDNIISALQEAFSDKSFSSGSEIFSISMAILDETAASFHVIGPTPIAFWKPLLKRREKDVFDNLFKSYSENILELKKKYKAPMCDELVKANEELEKIRAFKPVCEELSSNGGELTDEDKTALEYARVTVSKCVNTIMLLFNDLDNVNTPYMTAIDAIKEYKEIIDEALDYLISISNDAVATGKEAA